MSIALDFSCAATMAGSGSVRYTARPLNLYERLIQYFTVVAEARKEYLDLVNFSRQVFPEVLSAGEVESLFEPEHGYGCPDSSSELSRLICYYERERAEQFWRATRRGVLTPRQFDGMAVGCGAGTTGVMNCLIPAVKSYAEGAGSRRHPSVVLTLPQYSVYDGIVSRHGLQPRYLHTQRENDFLPTPESVEYALRDRPIAVILTYPGNPAQTTFAGAKLRDLERITRICQDSETFLIVDNVYQDTLWREGTIAPEVLALGDGIDYLIKVAGPSKDRPGMAGMRLGYYCGDGRIREQFFYNTSIQYNTQHSGARCMLALDVLFRLLRLLDRPVDLHSLELLGDHVAGWGRPLDRHALCERLYYARTFDRYNAALRQVEITQKAANQAIVAAAAATGAFCDIVNGGIGNVILLRACPSRFGGTDHELFEHALKTAGLGILPGNAFGFPIKRGHAWFRITTIHAPSEEIVNQVERLAACF